MRARKPLLFFPLTYSIFSISRLSPTMFVCSAWGAHILYFQIMLKYKGNRRNLYPVPGTVFVCLIAFKALINSLHWAWIPFSFAVFVSLGSYSISFFHKCLVTKFISESLSAAECVWLHAGSWEGILEQIHCKQPQLAWKQGSLTNPPSCFNRRTLKTDHLSELRTWGEMEEHQMLQS